MPAEWVMAAAGAMGAVGLVLGVLVRCGRARRWTALYGHPDLPAEARNGFVGAIPLGLMFLLVPVAFVALNRPGNGLALGTGLIAAAVACGIFAFFVIHRPPEWLKPAWLREDEAAARARGQVPDLTVARGQPGHGTLRPLSPMAYRLSWAALILLVALAWLLHWPSGVYVGASTAAPLLLAARPRAGGVGDVPPRQP